MKTCRRLVIECGERCSLFPLGDVAGDLRGADHLPVKIHYGRDGKRDVEQSTVFAPADCLIRVDALATADAREDSWLFVVTLGRHQHRHGPTDRFEAV
jgi:hypothetical protein